jgi:hypothetical protein
MGMRRNAMQMMLNVPEEVAREARAVADRTGRRVEDVLADWLGKMADELPVEALSDERVLELCDLQMTPEQQDELSDLLTDNREGRLQGDQYVRLEMLMQLYRRGLVRKAEALKVAVQRGLRPSLS